jgi:hypothetical protein
MRVGSFVIRTIVGLGLQNLMANDFVAELAAKGAGEQIGCDAEGGPGKEIRAEGKMWTRRCHF